MTTSIGGFAGELYSWGQVNGSVDPRVMIQEIFTNVDVNPIKPTNSSEVTAGGLAGKAQGALIQDINCAGPIKGWGPAGGVIGHLVYEVSNGAPSNITQVVSLGKVTSNRTPVIWRANPDNQYRTLVRIPDPGAQPL